jgi:hypothetical protein
LAFHSGREADHSPPSSAEVKEWVEFTSIPQYAFMAWCSVRGSTGATFYLLKLVSQENSGRVYSNKTILSVPII